MVMVSLIVIIIISLFTYSHPFSQVNLNLQESEVNHALHDAALLSSVLEAGL